MFGARPGHELCCQSPHGSLGDSGGAREARARSVNSTLTKNTRKLPRERGDLPAPGGRKAADNNRSEQPGLVKVSLPQQAGAMR